MTSTREPSPVRIKHYPVQDILRSVLQQIGADGLCADDCGCGLDDLVPCGADPCDCVAARYVANDDGVEIYVPMDFVDE